MKKSNKKNCGICSEKTSGMVGKIPVCVSCWGNLDNSGRIQMLNIMVVLGGMNEHKSLDEKSCQCELCQIIRSANEVLENCNLDNAIP